MMKAKWWCSTVAVTAMMVSVPWVARSHTAYQPQVRFTEEGFPERPIEDYTRGRLGIIQPSWGRGYLVVAYRELNGRPLSEIERRSFLANRDLVAETDLRPDRPGEWRYHIHDDENGWPQRWVRERAKYRKDEAPSPHDNGPYGDKDWWKYAYDNVCGDDSFRVAIQTLRDRAKRYGSGSQALNDWINGQDRVYLNCNQLYGRNSSAVIPAELPNSSTRFAKADRAYQVAAAHFYSHNYQEAMSRFGAIGNDATSPWQELGRYLACRMALRQVMPEDFSSFDRAALVAVELRLRTYSNSARDPELKRSAAGLVEYIALRLRPKQELVRLSDRLSKGMSGARFAQDVIDIGFLTDRQIGEQPDFPGIDAWSDEYDQKAKAWKNSRYSAVTIARESSELVDWLMTFQWGTSEAASHAYQRWKGTRSQTWLVAAVTTATGKESWSPELVAAAAEVPQTSRAFLTVSYHRARLLRESGEQEKARAVLDHLLNAKNVDTSSVNLMKEQRGLASESLEDYLRWIARQPVGYTNNTKSGGYVDYCEESHWGCEREVFEAGHPARLLLQMSDDTSLAFSYQLPLTMMMEAARSGAMPENLRSRLIVAAWARAVMLDRKEEAASLKAEVLRSRPEMKAVVEEYAGAKTPEERQFLAAYAIAHFPGLRPTVDGETPRVTRFDWADNYRDNWWCKGEGEDTGKWGVTPTPVLSFLTEEQRNAAKRERAQLFGSNVGDGLTNTLVNWAKNHRDDPRSAEALYYAMRVMRFSCDGSTKRSREVYLLLHQRYPSTVWAKKTKVWYSN